MSNRPISDWVLLSNGSSVSGKKKEEEFLIYIHGQANRHAFDLEIVLVQVDVGISAAVDGEALSKAVFAVLATISALHFLS
jgi:hypothetical protein